jgi:hypothetical protein
MSDEFTNQERLHPVRGDMFIDRGARPLRLRSKERNGSGVVKLYLNSAPSNGVRTGDYARAYKHFTPNGVETSIELFKR